MANSQARYLPFGKYRVTPTAGLTDRGFTGHLHNDPIGLVYMNARYYVPSIGRFASADTIVPDPKNPQTFNRYGYVHNNPLRFTDPTGHYLFEEDPDETWKQLGSVPLTHCANWDCNVARREVTTEDIFKPAVTLAGMAVIAGTGPAVVTELLIPAAETILGLGTVACADGDCGNEVNAGLGMFSRAADFGIRSYRELRTRFDSGVARD